VYDRRTAAHQHLWNEQLAAWFEVVFAGCGIVTLLSPHTFPRTTSCSCKLAGRRLPLPLALKYSTDIAKGLVELHRLGVTAADLKPDNVLIDDELGDAVIADFGISSVVTSSIAAGGAAQQQRGGRRGGGGVTRSSGVLRGTPNYM
jgi:serine/threonine protein kinase